MEVAANLSVHEFDKLRLLTSAGSLELLFILRSRKEMTYSEVLSEVASTVDVSSSIAKKRLKALVRCRILSREKKPKKNYYVYQLSDEGSSILDWVRKSPIGIAQEVLLCDKCFGLSESSHTDTKCQFCAGTSLMKGLLVNGFFVEEDGMHVIRISGLNSLEQDMAFQRPALRLLVLDILRFRKRIMKRDQIMQKELIDNIERLCGSFDESFVNKILADMVKRGEIYFPVSGWISTKLNEHEIEERMWIRCSNCNRNEIELIYSLVKDSLKTTYDFVCPNHPRQMVCSECASRPYFAPKCRVCGVDMVAIDVKQERRLVRELYDF